MFTPGMQIGDLLVGEELQGGDTSRLFRAERRGPSGFRRHVLLKVGCDDLAGDPRFEARLLGEAARAAAIDHPHVRAVERVGTHAGRPFLVLEHIDGCSLAELLAYLRATRRRLRPELAVHLALQVASALHATHECGSGCLALLHRDVRPPNVLLSRWGHVKLIDYGHASASRTDAEERKRPRPVGPTRYAAPEEVRREEVDRRADIYSLGACLWEMLTLCEPFGEGAPGDRDRVPAPVAPSRLVGAIPTALDRVVLRALAAYPEDRPPTARAFRHALVGAAPGALLVEEEEVARLVEEARTWPPGSEDHAPTAALSTRRLDPKRLQTLRRRSRPSVPPPPTMSQERARRPRRGTALTILFVTVGVGAGAAVSASRDAEVELAADHISKVRAWPAPRSAVVDPDAGDAPHSPPRATDHSMAQRSGPAASTARPIAPRAATRTRLRSRGMRGPPHTHGARLTASPDGAPAELPARAVETEPPHVDDWPVPALDELGTWD